MGVVGGAWRRCRSCWISLVVRCGGGEVCCSGGVVCGSGGGVSAVVFCTCKGKCVWRVLVVAVGGGWVLWSVGLVSALVV